MAKRQAQVREFLLMDRDDALRIWCGWWTKFIDDNYRGMPTLAAKDLFGISEVSGAPIASSQCQKWQFVHNNSLPGQHHLDIILKKANTTLAKILKTNYPPRDPSALRQGNRSGNKKGKKLTGKSEAVFTVDNPNVPHPDISFNTSEEFDNMYDLELVATMPLAGVLAIMALLEDAYPDTE